MQAKPALSAHPIYLGIEGGGTHSRALFVDTAGAVIAEGRLGPANLRLLRDPELLKFFRAAAALGPRPIALGIGLAGARTENDRIRIRAIADKVWPGVPCHATNDLDTALMAACVRAPLPVSTRRQTSARRSLASRCSATVLVISGTGSCCYGRSMDGESVRVGGWGHILGDQGSGYDIGLQALRIVIQESERTGRWPKLGARLLRALLLNEPEELTRWALRAGKPEVARLAVEVFAAAQAGDQIARKVIETAATSLAADAVACAQRLARAGQPARFVLAGGVLLKQAAFARQVSARIRKRWRPAIVARLEREGAWGAVELARALKPLETVVIAAKPTTGGAGGSSEVLTVRSLALSPTEQRNPRSTKLDQLSPGQAIELMVSEDARIPPALRAEKQNIERALRLIVSNLKRGGRLFYVGAGTSGRLGVLDASECPPTFRTDPEMVQGIMAGGQHALWTSVEGAEDDADAGARAVEFRGVTRRDVVVGIAASGRTPFVWGALGEAKRRGSATVLLCFNPHLSIPRGLRPAVIIAPKIGPEILTGSTRLKAGTATKLILNLFTTLAMVRLGKVLSNLMTDVNASNTKLRDRAVRITRELTGADYAAAEAALLASAWDIKQACRKLGRGVSTAHTARR